MTLKEKFRQELTGHLSDEKTEVDVNIATRIAEEFAIGFVEWYMGIMSKIDIKYIGKTGTQLLEIYKKEIDYEKMDVYPTLLFSKLDSGI